MSDRGYLLAGSAIRGKAVHEVTIKAGGSSHHVNNLAEVGRCLTHVVLMGVEAFFPIAPSQLRFADV